MTAPKTSEQVFAFPASFAQERLWLLANLEPGDPAYHIAGAVSFKGVLDVHALQTSLNEVVRRHESLRTTFKAIEGRILQVVLPIATISLKIIAAPASNGNGNESEFWRQVASIVEEPFDLVAGPLLRAALLKRSARDHMLVLAIHHIISDGWSLIVLVRELMELYQAFVSGTPAKLPALPIQYVDYTDWQRKSLSEEKLQDELSYWKRMLDSVPVLDLPTDYNRPALQRHCGARQRLRLPSAISAALIEFSKQEQTTLFMVLLAAFKVLLHRYTGSEDIVVGTPVAGRKRPELESLVGCFLNTLVLRTQIPANASFIEVLHKVREVALDAYSHEDTPFEKVLEAINPKRTLSHTPLFQVFVNMLALPEPLVFQLPAVTAELVDVPETTSKFDFTLYIYAGDGKIDFSLVYNTDLFADERIVEMLRQFEHLLRQIIENPGEKISQHSLVTESARSVLPNPRMVLDARWEGAVHELFRANSERHPNQLAVADPHVLWNYLQVEKLSNQLANYLLGEGIQPQNVVAIYAHRSAPLVVALLGIMKAGAAFLVLDPAYPAARLVDYLEIAQPKAFLHLQAAGEVPLEVKELLARSSCPVLNLPSSSASDFESSFNRFPCSAPMVKIEADDLAYVSFTSGSTGKPKGVLGRHGPLSHFVPWLIETFNLNESDRFSLFSALSHDPLHRDVFTPLMIGASVCIPPPEEWQLPGKGAQWMRDNRISISNLTPAMGQVLTQGKADCVVDSLRYVFFVGDALTRRDISEVHQLAPRATCINFYGATETQRAVSFCQIPPSEVTPANGLLPIGKDIVPLGVGIKDVQLLVLNQSRQLAGIGEAGEIYLRSPHIAKGYLGDSRLSNEKFVCNWFTGAAGDQLYRTGDLGRYLPSGSVETMGRADTQVKIRGFRIELGEIEAVLKRHPLVKAAAVLPWQDISGNKHLAGYVVLEHDQLNWQRDIFKFVARQLPDYMVPGAFVSLPALPLTPNGKLDRRALPAPNFSNNEQTAQFIGPRSPEEELLCSIFAEVLKRERVGVDWNFFEMGGHSLLATQVIGRIRRELAVDLPLRSLFQFPTVADLARQVREGCGSHVPAAPSIEPVDRKRDLPLSFAQQRLWFLDQLQPGNTAYNLLFGIRLSGSLDIQALRHSLREIVQRHEILRTTFPERDGTAVQRIAERCEVHIEEIDLRELTRQASEEEVRRHRRAQAERPFDLQNGPLLRVMLLRLEDTSNVLLVAMHHIVSDGWSMDILVQEFGRLYEAHVRGQKPSLPKLEIQYGDYAVWQRKWLEGEVLEQQLGYWRKQLADVPVLQLPADHTRQPAMSNRGATITVNLNAEMVGKIKSLSRRQGMTLFMTLVAGWQLLLSRSSGQSDIAVGSPIAGRIRPEVEPLIGFFVNALVLRVHVRETSSFRELLKQVRERTLEAYEHQDVPFEKLVDELHPERDLSRQPFFQVVFGLQNTSQEQLRLPDLQLTPIEREDDFLTTKFDLTLLVAENEQEIHGRLEYVPDLFEKTTAESMVRGWQMVLEQVIENPDEPVARISLLTDAERRELVMGWSASGAVYPQRHSVGRLVTLQAERRPQAVALVSEGQAFTFNDLNRRANQWAHYLRIQEVQPGERVAVCLKEASDLVVISLGILKSGAVLVGLEAEEPPLRRARMLESSLAALVITVKSLGGEFAAAGVRVRYVEELRADVARQSEIEPEVEIDSESPACVLYRSSTVGRPVGVVLSQMALSGPELQQENRAHRESERVAQRLGFAREAECLEWWRTLVGGGCLVSVDDGLPPRKLANLLREQKVTVLRAPATSIERMAREFPWALKNVLEIGCEEAVPVLARLRQTLPAELLGRTCGVSGYSEAGGCWMKYPVAGADGKAVVKQENLAAGITMWLLDTEMSPVPNGVVGEIYLGGSLAQGYHCEPLLTASSFAPNPFLHGSGERLYRTGERGWRRADGCLELHGRHYERAVAGGVRVDAREIEAVLAEYPGVRQSPVVVRESSGQHNPGITAVIVGADEAVLNGELRRFVQDRLPAVMVPQAFIQVEQIEQNADGIDRRAVTRMVELHEVAAAAPKFEAPRTDVEKILTSIWEEVLNVGRVGVHDNFFKLGGDSILSIQVIARARQAGVVLLPRQIFEKQTIAELAAVAGSATTKVEAEQGVVSGDVPLTPFQARFFQWELERPQHFNQSVLLQLDSDADMVMLEQAVMGLIEHHDALRMRYGRSAVGWQQVCQAKMPAHIYERRNLAGLNEREQKEEFERDATRIQGSLDLIAGHLIKAVEYDLGIERGKRLLLVVHHLVVDGLSWRILLEDLENAYQQRKNGKGINLGSKTTSFKQWAEQLRRFGQGEQIKQEVERWVGQPTPEWARLPRDYEASDERNLFETQEKVIVALEEEETRALLQDVPGIYNTQINDVLLTALGRVLAEWTGCEGVLVDLEGHGREDISADVDVSRTVGWFSTTYPLRLDSGNVEAWDPGAALAAIKERLRAIPNHGLGYGLLRYINDDPGIRAQLEKAPQPEVIFNYFGQIDQLIHGSRLFLPLEESGGTAIAGENRRPYILDVNSMVARGKLQVNWSYNKNLHRRETVERIANRYLGCLRELMAHCLSEDAGGFTPSDFTADELTHEELVQIAALLEE
jgi:amino acid adenylation domain-containing protein/non-ribosomal peptide synthase protein (TIGR01720 family)